MLVHVPGSLDGLLSLLAPCFSQPTFQTFRALVAGFIGRIGEHTVTGMWQAARLAGRVHHSRAHDFFARRRWDPDDLGLALLDFLVSVFVKPGAPLRLVVDEARRRGDISVSRGHTSEVMSETLTLTAVFTPDENGWTMAQLAEWPAVVTCGRTVEEAREMLLDAAREMVASYREEGREPPVGGGHVEPITIELAA
jgi:predicted RNase H-like HicB family nuclease